MARYYDIDKLKALIEAKADTLLESKEAFLYVSKWLDLLPHEDVAPKSEVDRLEYTLLGVMHSVDKWLDGDELKQDEVNRAATMRKKTLRIIENTKSEVARGIFEEIETCLYQPFDDIPDDPHYQICQQDYESIKKTYTEEKE